MDELLKQLRATLAQKLEARKAETDKIEAVRSAMLAEKRSEATDDESATVTAAKAARAALDEEIAEIRAREVELVEEQRSDEAAAALAREVGSVVDRDSSRTRVVSEPRTYSREIDPKGVQFLRDVAMQFMRNDRGASDRLSRHMSEELVERGDGQLDRAVGTAGFSGLIVPQYLTDLFAPVARAGRPFADACRHHDLPAEGMTAEIGKGTTGTDVDEQAAEGDAVKEQDYDDTTLSVPILTNAGQQSVSRQAVERGRGVDDTTLEDLFRAFGTRLSNKLLNRAATGLGAVATAITYTSASPTAEELYPKLLKAVSDVEGALLDQDAGDTILVMHSRRWYWMQSQLSAKWPMFGQPGVAGNAVGVNYAERYGSGFRGILPNGTPVIVDNNVATNQGAGTEDAIYAVAQSEAHLWEDPSAPMLIRAEDAKASNLQILFVVYGYYAHLFNRRAHAQKITGTGLIAPTF